MSDVCKHASRMDLTCRVCAAIKLAAASAEVERLRDALDLIERETLEVRIQEVARITLDARKREAEK